MIDVEKILKAMDINIRQRKLLIPFFISLPIVYMTLCIHWDEFMTFAFYDRLIFAAATTIMIMVFCYLAILIGGRQRYADNSLIITIWVSYLLAATCFILTFDFSGFIIAFALILLVLIIGSIATSHPKKKCDNKTE